MAGRLQSWVRQGAGAGHHRGRRAGHASRGVTRERGSAIGLLALFPGRRTKSPGGVWGFAQSTSPSRTARTHCSEHGSGARATSDVRRDGLCVSLRDDLGRGGSAVCEVGEVREAPEDLYPTHTQDHPQHRTAMQGSPVMRQRGAATLVPRHRRHASRRSGSVGAGWVTTGSTRRAAG
jgi:hypothetical protein